MDNTDKYDLLAERENGLPSTMGIIPHNTNFKFDAEEIEKALTKCKDFKLNSFTKEDDNDYSILGFSAEVEYLDEVYNMDLYVCETSNIDLANYGFGNKIDAESLEIARKQQYYLETSMSFGEDPLTSFHLQLKIMNAIVPVASLIIDFMSYRLLSAKWLTMTAKSPIPPSPDYLYTLHCIYNDEEDGTRRYWFHTHGLHRCGTVELEMLNITQGAEQMHTLINMTVKKFLSNAAQERERFMIGYDGMGINLCWLRWEEALNDFSQLKLGGKEDRESEDGDNVHAEPSGILFAVEDGNMVSPEIYASTLSENPIYYITTEETNRMSALAKERFSMFKQVFEKESPKPESKSFFKNIFGSKKQEDDERKWTFLVKLGLNVDNPDEGASEKEHLWFETVSIDSNQIEGKLLNQPYWISNLNEGDVKTYPVELLTDWIIYSPDSTYTTDSIYELGFLE